MSRRDELLAKTQNNPRGVAFRDLEKLLEWHGFELRRIRGSHHLYSRGRQRITLVWRRPHVHPDAVREVLDIIEQAQEE